MQSDKKWSVAIIASREEPAVLKSSLVAACSACRSASAFITVLVNGNERLAHSVAEALRKGEFSLPANIAVDIWQLALPDKAETWNRYVHDLWTNSSTTFFLDGYVRPRKDAFTLLERYLDENEQYASASGVPLTGRSAGHYKAEVTEQGWGLHGNLYALPQRTLEKLRSSGFRIPKGLYRNDGFLAAALAFDLRPESMPWHPEKRLGVAHNVGWTTPSRNWWNPAHLMHSLKRKKRQQAGIVENAAIRYWLSGQKSPLTELPDNIQDLIRSWMLAEPNAINDLCQQQPETRKLLDRLVEPRDWSLNEKPPSKLFEQLPS